MGKKVSNVNNSENKNSKKRKSKFFLILLIVLVCFGIVGGTLIKLGIFRKVNDSFMSTENANRLIRYLGINDYAYADSWGSSFTIKDTRELIDASNVSADKFNVSFSGKPGFLPVTRKQFESVYETLIKELELDRLSQQSLYIFDVDSTGSVEFDGIVYELIETSGGDFYMEKEYGFPREYIGRIIDLYLSNNEIVLCLRESKDTVTINNAYAMGISEENGEKYLKAYVNSKSYDFLLSKDFNETIHESGFLCDIGIGNKGVVSLTDHSSDLVNSRVTSYSDGLVTVEGYEDPLLISSFFNVYKTKGTFRATRSAGTLIGYEQTSLYIKDGMIEAALLTEDIYAKNIRVLISNTNYTDYYFGEVTITSDADFTISYGETVEEHAAGDKIMFSNGSGQLQNGPARITSKLEDGRITVANIDRQYGHPSYRGTIELNRDDKGVLIVNDLPVEQYLYGVVPSEMPTSYDLEALKAQAICARAYAYRQMESDNYSKYGAHLDDSISCQVYNNVLEDDRAVFAVDDTYGVVPCYDGEVVEAFFFSTSCGTTSNNSSVWGGNQEPYLLDTMETDLNDLADLSDEQKFRDFIDGNLGTDFIEADEPFFRWNVGYTTETLTNTINSHLYERIEAMPEYILAKTSAGTYEKKAIRSIGDLVNVEVTKRGNSGIIEEMVITGTSETILVKGQSNARALLSPEKVTLRKQDGSTVTGWTTLPSAYFYIEGGNGYVIRGGGFGHGVGMSQNGANDMAKIGYMATDIIAHYYTGVELKDMYQMMGE